MARYFVGNGTNWSSINSWATSSGGASGAAVPISTDDVFLDGSSPGNLTLDVAANCQSLTCTGFTHTLTHAAGITLTIGSATAGASNVALLLVNTMTYVLSNVVTSALSFVSTSSTQQTITTGGNSLGSWTINGVGSNYLLADVNTANGPGGAVTLTAGSLNTNGQTCTWYQLASALANTRSLTLGASSITITATNAVLGWSMGTGGGLTLNAGTSTITMSGISGQVGSGNKIYNNLIFNGGGSNVIYTGGTFANLTVIGSATKTCTFANDTGLTVTGTLTITGNSAVNRILFCTTAVGTVHTITAAGITLANVDFRDITGGGAGAPFTGISFGNCGGNTNVIFDSALTLFAVNGSGTTNFSGSIWSTSSGGSTGSRAPLPQDIVQFDANSGTGIITFDMPRFSTGLSFSGFTGTAAFSSTGMTVYGSIGLYAGMTISGTQGLTLGGRGTQTLLSAGKTYPLAIAQNGPGGTYTLQDNLVTTGALTITAGTLIANGLNVTCLTFAMSSTLGAISMGSGTWNVTQATTGTIWSVTAGTVTAATSTIVIVTAATGSRTFAGGGKVYGTLSYIVAGSTGTLLVTGANTFATLNFSDANNARTLTLPSSTTTTITNGFNVNGLAGNLMTVNASSPGIQATLFKQAGFVSAAYLSLQDSNAQGVAWYAGVNSVNVSNNSGWFFGSVSNPNGFFSLLN